MVFQIWGSVITFQALMKGIRALIVLGVLSGSSHEAFSQQSRARLRQIPAQLAATELECSLQSGKELIGRIDGRPVGGKGRRTSQQIARERQRVDADLRSAN